MEKLTFIQVYAPTSTAKDEEMNAFYRDLTKAIVKAKNSTWYVVAGDLNAKVSERKSNESDIMGKFGYGQRNDRGEKLMTFCRSNELFITNSLFKRKSNRKWTWLSPNGITKNEIDFFITHRNNKQCVKNVEVMNCLKDFSDHRMLRLTFGLTTAMKLYHNQFKKRITISDDPFKIKKFNSNCCRQLLEMKNTSEYNQLEEILIQSSKHFGTKNQTESILSEKTKENLKLRHELYEKSKTNATFKAEHSKIRKISRKEIRKDVRNHEVKSLEIAIKNNQCLKTAKEGIEKRKNKIQSLKDSNGVTYHDNKIVLEIATNF